MTHAIEGAFSVPPGRRFAAVCTCIWMQLTKEKIGSTKTGEEKIRVAENEQNSI
jgi:hypothetical protein